MLNQILAASGWMLDLAFFLILILGTALGAYKGFINGIAKLAGKVVSIIVAVTFCVSFANFLELCFHMTTGIANGIAGAIAKNEIYAIGLPVDVAGAEISGALNEIGVGWIQRWLIALSFANVEIIPAGTTAAMLLGSLFSKWISIIISFILLILLIRLGVRLFAKAVTAIKEHFAPLRFVDQAFGAVLGFIKAGFMIFFLLLVCNWLPIEGLHAFIESSGVVGRIFVSEWFNNATSYAVSGAWFSDYIKNLLFWK